MKPNIKLVKPVVRFKKTWHVLDDLMVYCLMNLGTVKQLQHLPLQPLL